MGPVPAGAWIRSTPSTWLSRFSSRRSATTSGGGWRRRWSSAITRCDRLLWRPSMPTAPRALVWSSFDRSSLRRPPWSFTPTLALRNSLLFESAPRWRGCSTIRGRCFRSGPRGLRRCTPMTRWRMRRGGGRVSPAECRTWRACLPVRWSSRSRRAFAFETRSTAGRGARSSAPCGVWFAGLTSFSCIPTGIAASRLLREGRAGWRRRGKNQSGSRGAASSTTARRWAARRGEACRIPSSAS